MSVLFFDTSALVRRYDRSEPGSRTVKRLCAKRAGHALVIAGVTRIEVASALSRKGREGRLSASERDRAWRLFRSHRRAQYQVVALDESTYMLAERLLFRHQLRAYDALQLACALQAGRFMRDLSMDYRFCTSDHAQAIAARLEGLDVELVQ